MDDDEDLDELQLRFLALASAANANRKASNVICEQQLVFKLNVCNNTCMLKVSGKDVCMFVKCSAACRSHESGTTLGPAYEFGYNEHPATTNK